MDVGTRVRYIRIDNEEDKETGWYPPIGTFGTVKEITDIDILVKWDNGTKSGEWWCNLEDVEEAEEVDTCTALVDKIASFFEEEEENWKALKNCWLDNDKSDDLRKLLHKALKG